MRHPAAQFLVAIVWCGALAGQSATVTHNVNLRPTASTAHDPKRLLLPPEVVTLLAPDPYNGYYHIRTQQNEEGWLWSHNVSLSAVPPSALTYAIDDPACPAVGSHSVNGAITFFADTSDGGLRNMAKRHIPAGTAPVTLDLFAFHMLQDDVNSRFADAHDTKTPFHPTRQALTQRPTSSGTVSEGDLVQVAAYITAVRGEGNESVNCAGTDGTDIHLNVGAKNSTEWKGIVVEVIPQLGHATGWNVATLNAIAAAKLQVLVLGGLTYDNEHLVNDDAANPNGTQPKRISLWEIHPITAFFVCEVVTCNPANHGEWVTLTAWAAAHGP